MTRVATALLLIPVAVGLIFLAPTIVVRLVLAIIAMLCLRECLRIVEAGGAPPFDLPAYVSGALLVLVPPVLQGGAFLIGLATLLLALALSRARALDAALPAVAGTLFSVIYTCGPFALAARLHQLSPHWLLGVLLVNWIGDSAALYVGRAIGRRKMAPRISPGKTWEGGLASAAFGALAGAGYLLYMKPVEISPLFAFGFALAVNVASQFGDLAESALKRGAKMKDSGRLLPGHGGMLDRMDGALFAFTAAYLYLAWL